MIWDEQVGHIFMAKKIKGYGIGAARCPRLCRENILHGVVYVLMSQCHEFFLMEKDCCEVFGKRACPKSATDCCANTFSVIYDCTSFTWLCRQRIFWCVFCIGLELQSWDSSSAGFNLNEQLRTIGSQQPDVKSGTAGEIQPLTAVSVCALFICLQ